MWRVLLLHRPPTTTHRSATGSSSHWAAQPPHSSPPHSSAPDQLRRDGLGHGQNGGVFRRPDQHGQAAGAFRSRIQPRASRIGHQHHVNPRAAERRPSWRLHHDRGGHAAGAYPRTAIVVGVANPTTPTLQTQSNHRTPTAPTPGAVAGPRPPAAPRRPHRLVAHGHLRIDDWYWLTDRSDPDVLAYLRAENDYADAVLAPTRSLQAELFAEIKSRVAETDVGPPTRHGHWWYWSRTVEGKQYPIMCRRPDPEGALRPEDVVADARRASPRT